MKLEGFGSIVVLNSSLISFPPFNNELLFKKWITTPLNFNWLDIKKLSRGMMLKSENWPFPKSLMRMLYLILH